MEPETPTPFLAEAEALLGPRGLVRDADALEPWLTDWRGRYTGRALALAAPADTQEILVYYPGIKVVRFEVAGETMERVRTAVKLKY